jgi:hypothetical protein
VQISCVISGAASLADAKNSKSLRGKSEFVSGINGESAVQSFREKYFSFFFSESVIHCRHPAPT